MSHRPRDRRRALDLTECSPLRALRRKYSKILCQSLHRVSTVTMSALWPMVKQVCHFSLSFLILVFFLGYASKLVT